MQGAGIKEQGTRHKETRHKDQGTRNKAQENKAQDTSRRNFILYILSTLLGISTIPFAARILRLESCTLCLVPCAFSCVP